MTAAMTVLLLLVYRADKGSWRCGFSLFYRPDATGIPVATVAINGAQNAGLLAAKILAQRMSNCVRD